MRSGRCGCLHSQAPSSSGPVNTCLMMTKHTAGLTLVLNGSTRQDYAFIHLFIYSNQAGFEGTYGTKRLKKVELFGEGDKDA